MRRAISLMALLCSTLLIADAQSYVILRQPTLSRTQIAFVYAGDIWIVDRMGGRAKRITDGTGLATRPVFSPDGTQIAFTGEYQGNTDVFVIPSAGGIPRRLTWHPEVDTALGWSPDGSRVLFRSNRAHFMGCNRLYSIPIAGGFAEELPLPMAEEGSYSQDATHLAYVPLQHAFASWKHYRGGGTTEIWLADLVRSKVEKIPRQNSNDFQPMWMGLEIYFLSDRSGPVTLFAYDTVHKTVTQIRRPDHSDIKSASLGPGAIVYEQVGSLHVFDLDTKQDRTIDIEVPNETQETQARDVGAKDQIVNASISATGTDAVFETRGEIVIASVKHRETYDVTNTSGVAERDPAYSPDGKYLAYFSDESGEYTLHLRDVESNAVVRKINLSDKPSFFYAPTWSPDSKKIAYLDKHLSIWYLDLTDGSSLRVDTDLFADKFRVRKLRVPTWSPDSSWLAYTKDLKNHVRALFLYSLDSKESHQITDGMADVRFPVFDRGGNYLYFTASTDFPIDSGRAAARRVYVLALNQAVPSPLGPNKQNEPEAGPTIPSSLTSENLGPRRSRVDIDFTEIDQRILALPIPALNCSGLEVGEVGVIYLLEANANRSIGAGVETLYKFDFKKRQLEKLREGIRYYAISYDGKTVLYRKADQWILSALDTPLHEELVNIDELKIHVDPRAEWKQIFHEAIRIMRDFFYDPDMHGIDLQSEQEKFEPYVDKLASRADLNYLLEEVFGNLSVSHLTVTGGDKPGGKFERIGLLAADYRIENGRYRFVRIYTGENWNTRRGALTQPGSSVHEGEYLLSVNGRPLLATDNIYRFFEGLAGKPVVLRVGPEPNETGSRQVRVTAAFNEFRVRSAAWVEDNRRLVDQMSGGRVAYVFIPDTGNDGFSNFNRYFYSQLGRNAVIIDQRFNRAGEGGEVLEPLRRTLMSYISTRDGNDLTEPLNAIFGPKVMLINEYTESGGEALAYQFRHTGAGSLVGKRSWGGLIGFHFVPSLIDGGQITVPDLAHWIPTGEWLVENKGITPDVDVDFAPEAWRAGHDPQLEAAVAVAMKELKTERRPRKPPYPRVHR